MRCIWRLDVENRVVEKIVPEHEALYPWYIKWFDNECVVYVEEREIKIATEYWFGP